jgi:tRNA A-37 threonylcarbamoyl transferase component Bud32
MGATPESDRYRLLSEHFQVCAELPPEERENYISGPAVSDVEMRRELRSLLQFHSSDVEAPTPPPRAATSTSHDTGFRKGRRKRTVLAILAAGVSATVLTAIAVNWSLGRLEDDLRRDSVAALTQIVDARASALRSWAERQKLLARNVLADPKLLSPVATLADLADDTKGDPGSLRASPSFKQIRDILSATPAEISDQGFNVVSPSGISICNDSDEIIGRQVSAAGASYLRRCSLGEWIISRPYPDRQFTNGMSPDYSRPRMFVGGPILDDKGKLLAIGGFRFSPNREFFGLLPQSHATTLAFDEKGFLLNDCGESKEFRNYGLLDDVPGDRASLMKVRLRDPGGDLTSGYRPATNPDSWMPTLLCRRASEGGRGSSVTEYRDILGRPVLGAWTWLPEWDMGLGAEQQLRSVLAPMRPIRVVSYLFVLLPLGVTAGLLLMSPSFRSLMRTGRESTFGSYVLERSIGKGGMAEVFLARHEVLKRPAAVKILSNPDPDAAAVARFEREARLACRLGHPNTIQIFDYGETPEGKLYYAMEYVKGVTLAQLMAMESSLPIARVVHLLRQVAGAVEEAHALGLVHRDLKPSNIMVSGKGALGDMVKVLDFGIACASSPMTEDFTHSVELVGTPAYIAPERVRAPQSLDPRSDIYSFGAVAFNLLTGRNVFEGQGPAELIYQVMTAPRPSPSQLRGSLVPIPLEQLVRDCLSIEPEHRPADFRQILEILDRIATQERWDPEQAREWWNAKKVRLAAFTRDVS